ncbi:hypothetical protein DPMN_011629 [Dreissena polymorpha]|uniref:Uncharacterized protein n=1 Tax=Dreissena polymorpha TaxID=45954 RepID=A0A9D4S0G9_DREPO|nr:hypothetical protein DPMN_011629 [Dreissena polymorpha]
MTGLRRPFLASILDCFRNLSPQIGVCEVPRCVLKHGTSSRNSDFGSSVNDFSLWASLPFVGELVSQPVPVDRTCLKQLRKQLSEAFR